MPSRRPAVIAVRKTAKPDDADPALEAVAVRERDRDPVVGRALGEGGGEDDDADEQRARLAPGRTDAGLRAHLGARLVRLDRPGQERAQEPRGHDEEQHDDAGEVHGDRHVQERQPGADERADDRAAAEGGMEVRHDRAAEEALDLGALEVHRHVEDAGADADEHEAAP